MFSPRTAWKTGTNPLYSRLEALRRGGEKLLDLTESNPTRCGFRYLNEDLLKPLNDARNLQYTPEAQGLLRAREAVASYYEARGVRVDPAQIFLTASTSEAYSFVFRLLTSPGDRVGLPAPSYPLFSYLADLHDIGQTSFPLAFRDSWQLTPESFELLKDKSLKALMLVHPNNPTGHYVSDGDRARLLDLCGKGGKPLVVDEVFFDYALTPESRPESFAGTEAVLTFTLSGISKILGLPQMKLSWIVVSGPRPEREEAVKRLEIIADTFLSVSAPPQNALAAWLSLQPAITGEILERLRENHASLRRLDPGGRFLPVQGGWYAVLRLPDTWEDDAFALELLEQDRVHVHPGYLFDFGEAPYAVISLLTAPEDFREGLRRIAARLDPGINPLSAASPSRQGL